VLTEAAWGASRTKDTHLSVRYKKVAARRGKKRAIVAVGHSILTIVYHILKDKVDYRELGAGFVDEKKRQSRIKYYQQALVELGVDIAGIQSA
jgi:hypothetical protein